MKSESTSLTGNKYYVIKQNYYVIKLVVFYRIESQFDDAVLVIGVIKEDQTVKLLSSIESDEFPKLKFEQ